MEVLLLVGLIVLNGLFSMSELALVAARKTRLQLLADEGDSSAATAIKLAEDPTKFLSTVQIGITSIGILNGIVGDAVLAEPVAKKLIELGVPESSATIGATTLVVILVTYISIVVGELVPKRIAQTHPELIARLVARPMKMLAAVTRPFVLLLAASTHTLLKVLGVKPSTDNGVTEEEIQALLEEGSESGAIEQHQHEMVRNVFRLDDRQLGSLMIPRSDIVYIDVNLSDEENLKRILDSDHSRFPVCDGSLDNLLGIIHAKQTLAHVVKGEGINFREHLTTASFVPQMLTGTEVLDQFRNNCMQIAFVVDEYGEIEGMVTLQDVLEALTGEFTPRNAEDSQAIARPDGSWLLDGAIPVPELKDCLDLRAVPEEQKKQYHTIAGLIMLLLGRVPVTGDRVEWEDWTLEVIDMDGKRIDKVMAIPLLPATKESELVAEPA